MALFFRNTSPGSVAVGNLGKTRRAVATQVIPPKLNAAQKALAEKATAASRAPSFLVGGVYGNGTDAVRALMAKQTINGFDGYRDQRTPVRISTLSELSRYVDYQAWRKAND